MRGICLPLLSWPLTIGNMMGANLRLISTFPGGGLNSKFSISSIMIACNSSTLHHASMIKAREWENWTTHAKRHLKSEKMQFKWYVICGPRDIPYTTAQTATEGSPGSHHLQQSRKHKSKAGPTNFQTLLFWCHCLRGKVQESVRVSIDQRPLPIYSWSYDICVIQDVVKEYTCTYRL